MIKRILIATSLILTVLIAEPSAHADAKAISCKTPKNVATTVKQIDPPAVPKGPVKDQTLTLKTNCGDIVIEEYGSKAPLTVTVISYLANKGFYNNSLCHRIVTSGIFIVQCGDPSGKGNGGVNWSFNDENLPTGAMGTTYPAGTLAMANIGQPNTNSNQFFFTYKDGSQLGPNYTIWGKVIKGLDILNYVASKGNASNGVAPKQPLQIINAKAS